MTVYQLLEILKTKDKEAIVYISKEDHYENITDVFVDEEHDVCLCTDYD